MCISRTVQWADTLKQALRRVYEPTTRKPVPWLLAGEAAMSLQGVDTNPSTIEFRAMSAYAVAYFAGFMRGYEAPETSATAIYIPGGDTAPSEGWRSNSHQRLVSWRAGEARCWAGCWTVETCPVRVLHILGSSSDPISNMLPSDARKARFDGKDVAVVPLEFLLADSAQRGQSQVTSRILHTMRNTGYDERVLRRALDTLPAERASRLMRLLELRLVG